MEKLNRFLAWFVFVAYKVVMGLSWFLRACGGGLEWIGGKVYTGGLYVYMGGAYIVGWAETCAKKYVELDPRRKFPVDELSKARDRVR